MRLNASKYNCHWQDKALNELGEFQRGKSRHRPRNDMALFSSGKHPLIQTGEIKEANLFITKHSATYNDFGLAQSKLWPQNTLCITIAANIAETALLGYPMCFPDSVVGFNAYPKESSELFMHYVFTYVKRAIQNSATGSIQDNINIEYLTSLKLKIPLKDYQDKITAVLSAIDAKIELNNRINEELEAMAKLLYEHWFVQFDFPITAAQAAAMGKPRLEGKPYRASGGKMTYNQTLTREIPDGWEGGNILALSEIGGGATPSKKIPAFWGGDIPFFTPTDAEREPFCLDTEDHVTQLGLGNGATHLYPKGTLFITARGSVGKVVVASREMTMSQSCYALRPKTGVGSGFLYFHTLSLMDYLHAKSSGSIFNSIVTNDINFTPTVVPASQHLTAFNELVEPMFQSILTNQVQNLQLTELRDWLLPMLMNGQVTVG